MFGLRSNMLIRPTLRLAKQPSAVLKPVVRRPASTSVHKDNFFERNARLGRPMSPHLTIYAPQLTSVLSVSHRITGVAWHFALGLPAIGLAVTGTTWADALQSIKDMKISPVLIQSAKFFIGFPFIYHSINGVRHLVWDRAAALTLKHVYEGGYLVVALAFFTTAGLVAKSN